MLSSLWSSFWLHDKFVSLAVLSDVKLLFFFTVDPAKRAEGSLNCRTYKLLHHNRGGIFPNPSCRPFLSWKPSFSLKLIIYILSWIIFFPHRLIFRSFKCVNIKLQLIPLSSSWIILKLSAKLPFEVVNVQSLLIMRIKYDWLYLCY